MNQDIKQGSIVWICLDGKRGRGVPHPAVVLSVLPNIDIFAVVCTAHPKSKERLVEIVSQKVSLPEKTYAIISWRGEISYNNITKMPGGFVKGKLFQKITDAIKAAEANSEPFSLDFVEWFNIVQDLEVK
jgi:hypothetical protein